MPTNKKNSINWLLLIIGGGLSFWAGEKYLLPYLLNKNDNGGGNQINNENNNRLPYGLPPAEDDNETGNGNGNNGSGNNTGGKNKKEPDKPKPPAPGPKPKPKPDPTPYKRPAIHTGGNIINDTREVVHKLPQKKRTRPINNVQIKPRITVSEKPKKTQKTVKPAVAIFERTKRKNVTKSLQKQRNIPESMVSSKKQNSTTKVFVKNNDVKPNAIKKGIKQEGRFDRRFDIAPGIAPGSKLKGLGTLLTDILNMFDMKHAIWLYSEQDIVDSSKMNISNINERTKETKDRCCRFIGDFGKNAKPLKMRKIFY